MKLHELTAIITSKKQSALSRFADADDSKRSELEMLREEVKALKEQVAYLSLAQYYTAIVRRPLEGREIEALAELSHHDLLRENWVGLVRDYGGAV